MKTLFEALTPRSSVFERANQDTVWNLTDLESLTAADFFNENYITEAMRILLPEAFKRLEQKDGASGIYRLSQSMGGGKTHSLIALGLLAKDEAQRKDVLRECGYEVGSIPTIRTVAFGGAEPTPNGLWGFIAEKIEKSEVLSRCYTPLQAPTETEWQKLLDGEPTLILLDELPPYFESLQAITTGSTSLDALTTVALRNLFQAIHSNKLPNVCLVFSDLAGTAYQNTANAINALANADLEANRVATTLTPVNLNTDELYQILRKRLFENLPPEDDITEVADAYTGALQAAERMGFITDVSQDTRQRFIDSYPFHHSIRDLYARVKENASFQQTRALIRIMRQMVLHLWESGQAKTNYLIAAQHYDLLSQSMKSEIAQINPTFEAAIAKDIQDSAHNATAQRIDINDRHDAQDAAKLIFLSSLSTAVNPTHGLARTDIYEYLVEPNRDLTGLRQAVDTLQERANYLHPMAGAKLVFRNTENLVAKIDEYVRHTTADMREQELRKRLGELFKASTGDVYQEVHSLKPFDQILLDIEKIALIIYKPTPDSNDAAKQYFNQQTYKNRVCFLTSDNEPYRTALDRAAYLAAIDRIKAEPTFTNLQNNDPQRKQADELYGRYQSLFYQAISTGFTKLIYPYGGGGGLFERELSATYNQEINAQGTISYISKGEAAIKQALIEMSKFVTEQTPEALLPKLDRIWPEEQKTIEWNELRRLAASNPGFVWHHPRALEFLRDEMLKRDEWRMNGAWLEKGPFPQPAARVEVDRLSVDKESGRATIRVRPIPADGVVYHSTDGPATQDSQKLETLQFETEDLWHSFLCIDPSGKHPEGEAVTWTYTPTLKHGFPVKDGMRQVELRALPKGAVKYTIDGSSVDTSGLTYSSPFSAPPGSLIQARVEENGIKGEIISFRMPEADKPFVIDPLKPAVWKRSHSCNSTQETYNFLEKAKAKDVKLGGFVRLIGKKGNPSLEISTFEVSHDADLYLQSIETIRLFVPDPSVTLDAEKLYFASGRDLEEFAHELKIAIQENEVEQTG